MTCSGNRSTADAERADLVVIGAGQAGLVTAYAAHQAGRTPVALEASAAAAGSWPHYYDSLTPFSPTRYSELPGRRLPGDPDSYPRRDDVVDYLADYAAFLVADLDIDLRLGRRVDAVTHHHGALEVTVGGRGVLTTTP